MPEVLDLRILEREILQRVADALRLARLDLDLLDLDVFPLQRRQHALLLARRQQQQSLPRTLIPCRPPHAMNVRLRVLWGIDLQHPVHRGEVEPARRDVRREQDGVAHAREALERREARHLLLLPVELEEGHARVHLAERLEREAHLLAAREEHERLRLQVALDEAPEHVELPVERAEHVVLLERRGRRALRQGLVDADAHGVGQAEAREVGDGLRLGGGEEEGLARFGEVGEEGGERPMEAHVQYSVGFVQNFEGKVSAQYYPSIDEGRT